MESDLLVTGFPSQIARNRSIQLLEELKITATHLTEEDAADLQFVINTLKEDIVILDEGEQENTPLWWFRRLTAMLQFTPPIFLPCEELICHNVIRTDEPIKASSVSTSDVALPVSVSLIDGSIPSERSAHTTPTTPTTSVHPLLLCQHTLHLDRCPPLPFVRRPLVVTATQPVSGSLIKRASLNTLVIDGVMTRVSSKPIIETTINQPDKSIDLGSTRDEREEESRVVNAGAAWDLNLVLEPRGKRLRASLVELDRISHWDFDVFHLTSASQGWPLLHVGYALFHYYDLFNRLGLSTATFVSFLLHIEYGCNHSNNPFHNSLHVADMLQACHILMFQLRLLHKLTDFDILAVFLAAIIHDYRHAGLTNQYLIASQDSVAIIFNDVRLVENFACSSAFRLLASPELGCDLLSVFELDVRQKVRQQVIALVFSTNLTDHFFFLETARTTLLTKSTSTPLPASLPSADPPMFCVPASPPLVQSMCFVSKADTRADCLLKLVMKAADVAQSARDWSLYSRWAQLSMEEFYVQGDLERVYAMPISKFMDRTRPQEAHCHKQFVQTVVRPVFQLLCEVVSLPENTLTAAASAAMPVHDPQTRFSADCDSSDKSTDTECVAVGSAVRDISAMQLDACLRCALQNVDVAIGHWEEALLYEQCYTAGTDIGSPVSGVGAQIPEGNEDEVKS